MDLGSSSQFDCIAQNTKLEETACSMHCMTVERDIDETVHLTAVITCDVVNRFGVWCSHAYTSATVFRLREWAIRENPTPKKWEHNRSAVPPFALSRVETLQAYGKHYIG
jgi:hypothetical protein